ncbi:unnamed protein product [Cylindrotheca closterium]|uniref:Uncharacterized protein n=1 Tax=Cylindrotheca closterium TaxID=2856 RepID=A0AAD2FHF9_9STRA|nr:unnamed protein product [Cylindrotheca closterium]
MNLRRHCQLNVGLISKPDIRLQEFLTAQTKDAKKKKWKSEKAHNRFLWLQQMKEQEEARRRCCAQQKGSTGGLQAIQIEETLQDGTMRQRTITNCALVEEGCMQENAAQYDQTRAPHMTPPMAEPLYTAFSGAKAKSNSIALLKGHYSFPALLDPSTAASFPIANFTRIIHPYTLRLRPPITCTSGPGIQRTGVLNPMGFTTATSRQLPSHHLLPTVMLCFAIFPWQLDSSTHIGRT